MTYMHTLTALVLLSAAPAHAAGMELLPHGTDNPGMAVHAATPLDIGPLSPGALAALADLDGDPSVTTAQEMAMIAILQQVLGLSPPAAGPG